jgi:hypothetical protein
MNRQTTWGVVGAFAAAGVLGISLQPGASSGGDDSTGALRVGTRRVQAKASDTLATEKKRACDDLAQVLEAFLFIDGVPRPKSCSGDIPSQPPVRATAEKNFKQPLPALDPKFVIATLPDPIHTHLALFFDRMTEVIQQAAQDEGYSYEASWLPWDDQDETYLQLADDDQAAYRKDLVEDQPGILVFRHKRPEQADSSNGALLPYRDGLIVFVVGEDPTKGIHTEQFKNALAWIEKLKGLNSKSRARTVILGPAFSGSFPSLAKSLARRESGDDTGDTSAEHVRNIRGSYPAPLAIYSGTANSGESIQAFSDLASKPSLADLHINFHGFLEQDEIALQRYFQYLRRQNSEPRIAVISEDETVYGGSGRQGEGGTSTNQIKCSQDPLRLYYPRDIAALRSAYQTKSIFNTTATQQSSDIPHGRLPSDLADPEGNDHDSIRSYAGNQTPLSQESYLLGVVNAMRVCHSDYVVLRSTNPLDQLFLARYFRRAYPDARIVTDGADRLFERERGATGMGGTMSLSTYPLLERQREWIGSLPLSPGQRLFNSDSSEGTYIALRLLLHTRALSEDLEGNDSCQLPSRTSPSLPPLPEDCNRQLQQRDHKLPIPDYGMPSWMTKDCGNDCGRPPTWLTVMGRDGYWPIAAMNPQTTQVTGPIFCTKWNVSVTPLLIFVRGSRRGCGDVGNGFCFPHLHAPVLG